jgi:hypothetical protein
MKLKQHLACELVVKIENMACSIAQHDQHVWFTGRLLLHNPLPTRTCHWGCLKGVCQLVETE